MRKRTALLEWQIGEEHADWQSTPALPAADTRFSALAVLRRSYRRIVLGGLLALLLLTTAGGWLWHTAQEGVEQIEGELRTTAQMELGSVAQGLDPLTAGWTIEAAFPIWQAQRELGILNTAAPSDDLNTQLIPAITIVNLHDDRAVANIVTTAQDGSQEFRQTRFYRRTAAGWLRTPPDVNLWGPPRTLESSYFLFHFRQKDAQAVAAVASHIDALYTTLQRHMGLTLIADAEKLVIEVTVERNPGALLTPSRADGRFIVPSPALYLAPVELSDTALLAQSIALPLAEYMVEQARAAHSIPMRWRPLLLGLRLWQLWELDLPLAHWRQDVVKWLHVDVPKADSRRAPVLPDAYTDLCAMHSLWMVWPTVVGIPLECTSADAGNWSRGAWLAYLSRTQLRQLNVQLAGWSVENYDGESYIYRLSQVVTVATMVEYAVATYGDEQLPLLLASLAQYDDWDTLLPAVYGASVVEFETGWQAYLTDRYR